MLHPPVPLHKGENPPSLLHKGNIPKSVWRLLTRMKQQMKSDPKFYHFNKDLKQFSSELRSNSTLSEIIMWNEVLKARKLGYQFHRQRPVLNYIGDFFCKELKLFIELDGSTHFEKSVRVKDKKKQTEIESHGFTLLRFKDEEVVISVDEVRQKLKNWISDYEKMHPEVLERKKRRRRK